jgi:adenylyltransferase/sulfurtransferase
MERTDLPGLSERERDRYARHLVLPQLGEDGQRQLKAARVLIVGVGGLGSPIALYLASAGLGRIGIVDDDVVSFSNLQRQILHGEAMLDRSKVASAAARLADLNSDVHVETYSERFDRTSGRRIAAEYDLVVDGTDNFETRYVINDVCLDLGIPYVYGAIFRLEGQLSLLCADRGPCYRCLFPEPPAPETVPTGEQAGILGVVPGTIGTLQATEAIKWIAGIGTPLVERLLVYDAAGTQFEEVAIAANPRCPACGTPQRRKGLP